LAGGLSLSTSTKIPLTTNEAAVQSELFFFAILCFLLGYADLGFLDWGLSFLLLLLGLFRH